MIYISIILIIRTEKSNYLLCQLSMGSFRCRSSYPSSSINMAMNLLRYKFMLFICCIFVWYILRLNCVRVCVYCIYVWCKNTFLLHFLVYHNGLNCAKKFFLNRCEFIIECIIHKKKFWLIYKNIRYNFHPFWYHSLKQKKAKVYLPKNY